MKKALIVVDYQYDFADPKGKLYVPEGEDIKKNIEKRIKEYKKNNDLVIFSGDFHPQNHVSFSKWGEHCLVNSKGTEFYVDDSEVDLFIKKGTELKYDSLSAFYIAKDVDRNIELESELDQWLKKNNISELEICGLALDICVQATYDDAIKKGYRAFINLNLSKRLNF
ncbi:isochorismatase family protein [Spiroplasma floricola]|uniref:nicotinamidase n=1 Tax=Spiroplasma floricola 23-6 TaxID=1336749 RepID=A0A2K8SD80_9MOLU|nr:isochorismatase family protein [Spiroplasma floricola]AUB31419.1 pyrazinamidase/nicotinamidase [Spiroplasma floricola 23-6]